MINSDGLLRVAHLYIMGNEKCSQYHQGKVTLNESEICAGAENIVSGPCEVKAILNKDYMVDSIISHVLFCQFFSNKNCASICSKRGSGKDNPVLSLYISLNSETICVSLAANYDIGFSKKNNKLIKPEFEGKAVQI